MAELEESAEHYAILELEEALREYGQHKTDCAWERAVAKAKREEPSCTCGWTERAKTLLARSAAAKEGGE